MTPAPFGLQGQSTGEPVVSPVVAVGDRRVVTVLFADLSGFTRLGEQLDAEDLSALVQECFGALMEEVRARGGWLEKNIGDAILAVFGAPVAHEDDPIRAVRTALAMQDRMRGLNDRLGPRLPQPLALHIGVNTGPVVTRPSFDTRAGAVGDLAVVGDAVNVGARLQQAASAGQVLVGESTYLASTGAFDYLRVPPLSVKGKQQSLVAYECRGVRSFPSGRSVPSVRGVTSPLVGRNEQVAQLNRAVERLLEGKGGLVSIIGEAGLGKSRLVAEVRRRFAGRGLLDLEGAALSFGASISYWPFREVFKQFAGISEDDDEAASWAKLARRVSALFPDQMAEILPYLATPLALEPVGELAEKTRYLDGEAMGRQVFLASWRLFERLAQEQPVLLVLEDVHWMDESSAALLEHLLPLVARVPLLVCGISRPLRETPAARVRQLAMRDYADFFEEVALAPLTADAGLELVENLLPLDDESRYVWDFVLGKAEGNPFYMEEVAHALIDLRAVVRDPISGRWHATGELTSVALPDTLRGVIMARIDRLDNEVKQVLRTASVIGRSFFYRVLGAVESAGDQLDHHLAELEDLDLIREHRRLPEYEYLFKHAVTQEATYESILLQRRRETHRRVGRVIEALFGDRIEEFYGILAYHYARGEDWEKAQEYLFKAGDQAGRMASDAEALEHYRRAIEAYARAFGDRWDPIQRASLERKIGEAQFRLGQHGEAEASLNRALTYLGETVPRSPWGIRWAILTQLITQAAHWIRPGRFTLDSAGEAEPVAREIASSYQLLGWIHYFTNHERMFLEMLALLNASERRGHGPGIAVSAMGIGLISDYIAQPRLAARYHRLAVRRAEQLNTPDAKGQAYLGSGIHEDCMGRLRAAVELFDRSAAAFWDAGDLRGWAAAAGKMCADHYHLGNLEPSLEIGRRLTRVGMEGGDRQAWGWGLYNEATNLMALGSSDEASPLLERAIELLKSVPDYVTAAAATARLGRCYLRRQDLRTGMTLIQEANQTLAEHAAKDSESTPVVHGLLAEGLLACAEQSPGGDASQHLEAARRACRIHLSESRVFHTYRPQATRLRGTYEWLAGNRDAAVKDWRQSIALAEGIREREQLGLTYLEIGGRTGDLASLDKAASIFAEIGAEYDLAQAQLRLRQA